MTLYSVLWLVFNAAIFFHLQPGFTTYKPMNVFSYDTIAEQMICFDQQV